MRFFRVFIGGSSPQHLGGTASWRVR